MDADRAAAAPGGGDDPMRYAVVGGDGAPDTERLEKYTGEVDWPYLRSHFASGALLYVDAALSITAVGAALAADDRAKVEGWLRSGDLVKPGQPHAAHWEAAGGRFTALVVSPFVLMQAAPDADHG